MLSIKKYYFQFKNILKGTSSNKEEFYHFYENLEELPFINWLKIYREKSLVYLIKNVNYRKFTVNPKLEIKLDQLWTTIYDEYMDMFGMTKKFKRVMELERKIALLKCEIWLDDNKFKKNQVKIFEKQLEKERLNTIDKKGNDYERQVVLIEKWLNSSIDIKKISTKKYFTYLELIQEEANNIKLKEQNVKN